jgi:pectate lyase
MQRRLICGLSAVIALLVFTSVVAMGADEPATTKPATQPSTLPAFPGAEGWGSTTPGGRGGKVIEVTNLNDAGPGSLRAAIDAEGPRIVVFRVSGTIALKSALFMFNPKITIAGQTAPGDGICLRNYELQICTQDVIVRYLRIRRGTESGDKDGDGLDVCADPRGRQVTPPANVMVDHCTVSWTCDEVINTWHGATNTTIQWCIMSEALHGALKPGHGFAATLGGVNTTYHHNLFANCPGRNPSIGGNNSFQTINLDFRNNVVFNYEERVIDGKPCSINFVNNYYKPGPETRNKDHIAKIDSPNYEKIGIPKWYIAGNVMEGNPDISGENNAKGVIDQIQYMVNKPVEAAPVRTLKAEEVYPLVLADAGATLPHRDPVDRRIAEEAKTGKTTFGQGVVQDASNVGGWPELKSAEPPIDSDHDGIPDWWEKKYGLNPNDASDGAKDMNGDGYTNVEKYLNGLDPTKKIDWRKPENNVNTLKPGSLDEPGATTKPATPASLRSE